MFIREARSGGGNFRRYTKGIYLFTLSSVEKGEKKSYDYKAKKPLEQTEPALVFRFDPVKPEDKGQIETLTHKVRPYINRSGIGKKTSLEIMIGDLNGTGLVPDQYLTSAEALDGILSYLNSFVGRNFNITIEPKESGFPLISKITPASGGVISQPVITETVEDADFDSYETVAAATTVFKYDLATCPADKLIKAEELLKKSKAIKNEVTGIWQASKEVTPLKRFLVPDSLETDDVPF